MIGISLAGGVISICTRRVRNNTNGKLMIIFGIKISYLLSNWVIGRFMSKITTACLNLLKVLYYGLQLKLTRLFYPRAVISAF